MQSRYKQILNYGIRAILVQRTTYVKHLSSLNIISGNTTKNDPNSKANTNSSLIKYIVLLTSSLTGFYLLKTKSIIPSVEAAINLNGRRGQFNFISDVVEQSAPSVVYIEIKDMKRFDFFTGAPLTASNGSGFIIKEDGLILTNAHVVVNKPNSRIDVRLHDGTTHVGTLETVDLDSDLALIRIKKTGLPVMKLGKSSDMRPGEFVVAIGSPLSLSNTCTCGVISSPNRGSSELGLKNKEMVYIQTDAAITFGNSGGPLMNLDGEAIGVNSMKVTSGISFAIPIDYVRSFLLKSRGIKPMHARRRYMGITMLTLTPQIIHELHERQHRIPDDLRYGILVWKVILDSPAHKSGLQPGDILTHINGNPVRHANEIYDFLEKYPTEKLRMTVIRFGQQFVVNIVPEDSF